MFLCKWHAAGGYTSNLFEFCFAFCVSAPHCFDEAGFFVCNLNQFIQVESSPGAVLAVLECFFVHTVMNSLQQFGYFAFQFVQRNKGLFAVVAANDNALVLFDILWTDLQTKRNTLHLVLSKLPAWRVVGDVNVGAELFCDNATELISEAAVAIANKLKIEDVAKVIHPHPTVSESLSEAVWDFTGLATHKR